MWLRLTRNDRSAQRAAPPVQRQRGGDRGRRGGAREPGLARLWGGAGAPGARSPAADAWRAGVRVLPKPGELRHVQGFGPGAAAPGTRRGRAGGARRRRPRLPRLDSRIARRAARDGDAARRPRTTQGDDMTEYQGMRVTRDGDVYRTHRESREALIATAVDFGARRTPELNTTLAFFDHM